MIFDTFSSFKYINSANDNSKTKVTWRRKTKGSSQGLPVAKLPNRIMKASKAKAILSTVTCLVAVSFIMASATFAWFNFNITNNQSIVATAGNISLTDFSANALKYVYPTYGSGSSSVSSEAEPMYNYQEDGTVQSFNVLTQEVPMNKYDPFILYLRGEKVDVLYTNIVLKISYTCKTYTNAKISLKAERSANWPTSKKRITDYLDFWISTVDFSSTASVTYNGTVFNSTDTNGTLNVPFYGMKENERLCHNSTETITDSTSPLYFRHFYGDETLTSLTLNSSDYSYQDMVGGLVSNATALGDGGFSISGTFYLNIDYNQATLYSYSTSLSADTTISLGMDYSLILEAIQD